MFDERLIISAIKLKYLKAKGMPAQDAEDEYREALALAIGVDGATQPISMTGACGNFPPMGTPPGSGWGL